MVFNKIDRISSSGLSKRFTDKYSNSIALSAKTGEGFNEFMAELGKQLRPVRQMVELLIPHSKSNVIARLHEIGQVLERNYDGKEAFFKALIPPNHMDYFSSYILNKNNC